MARVTHDSTVPSALDLNAPNLCLDLIGGKEKHPKILKSKSDAADKANGEAMRPIKATRQSFINQIWSV
jgi:hypothetical protein